MAQSSFFPSRPDLTPQIYAYSYPRYEGMLKAGYTTRDVQKHVADQYPIKRLIWQKLQTYSPCSRTSSKSRR